MPFADIHVLLTLNSIVADFICESLIFSFVIEMYWYTVPEGSAPIDDGLEPSFATVTFTFYAAAPAVNESFVRSRSVLLIAIVAVSPFRIAAHDFEIPDVVVVPPPPPVVPPVLWFDEEEAE